MAHDWTSPSDPFLAGIVSIPLAKLHPHTRSAIVDAVGARYLAHVKMEDFTNEYSDAAREALAVGRRGTARIVEKGVIAAASAYPPYATANYGAAFVDGIAEQGTVDPKIPLAIDLPTAEPIGTPAAAAMTVASTIALFASLSVAGKAMRNFKLAVDAQKVAALWRRSTHLSDQAVRRVAQDPAATELPDVRNLIANAALQRAQRPLPPDTGLGL